MKNWKKATISVIPDQENLDVRWDLYRRIIFLVVVVIGLTVVASIITILVIFGRSQQRDLVLSQPPSICNDPLCTQKTNTLIKYSNMNLDPCQDFYEFSCNNFDQERINTEQNERKDDWTPRLRLEKWAFLQLERMLEDKNIVIRNQSKSFDLATQYYKACLMKYYDMKSGAERLPLFQKLISLFQEIVQVWEHEDDNLEYVLGFLAVYEVDSIVRMEEMYSSLHDKYIISIDSGDLTHEGSYTQMEQQYQDKSEDFMNSLNEASRLVNDVLAEEVRDLELSLFKISYNYSSSSYYNNNSGYFRLSEVQHMLKVSLNLSILINENFNKQISEDQLLFVKNVNYLKNLHQILERFKRKDIFNLLKWHFIRASSKFLSSDFSEFLSFVGTNPTSPSRDCLPSTMDIFWYATGILYAQERRLTTQDKQLINDMFNELKESLDELIKTRSWLVKSELRHEMRNELQNIQHDLVGDQALELSALDDYYNELSITRNQLKNFFGGMVMIKSKEKLFNWVVNPVDTQLAFNPATNKLEIPLGLLQSPVFQSVYPISVLFGSLGSIISRQLSYLMNAFDFGDLRGHGNCYSKYYQQESVFNSKNFDEKFVKSEIEADHLSIRLSYSAYKMWQSKMYPNETSLKIYHLTTDQIFFLSYAQTWCRTLQPTKWMDLNPNYDFTHPSKERINNVLKNIPEFSEEFKCPIGSPMNPQGKCQLW